MVNLHDETGEITPPEPASRSETVIDRVLDAVAWACMLFAGVLLVFLIVSFGWLVYGRYVLNDTPTWVEQTSLLIISYITFLGAAVGVRRNSHLSIDFVREGLPDAPRAAMRVVADLFVIVFGGFMAWQGWGLVASNMDRMIPMLGIAEGWRALPMAICGVLMIVFAGYNIVSRDLVGRPQE